MGLDPDGPDFSGPEFSDGAVRRPERSGYRFFELVRDRYLSGNTESPESPQRSVQSDFVLQNRGL